MAQPIIPWPGGKRRLARHILPLIEAHPHTCYVEPFAGGAAMLFARAEPARAEVLNDINRDLVTLYRVLAHHLDEFVRQFRWALTSREMFRWAQLQDVDTLTDVQRAARFYYLQRLSFGGKVSSRHFGTSTTTPARVNFLRIEEDLSAAHMRLAGVTIECMPWRACMERYDRPHTLFFADPPYYETEGYGVPFELAEYEALAATMAAAAGRVVLTVNDHPAMRRVFAGFDVRKVDIAYTMARGDSRKPARELVITSR